MPRAPYRSGAPALLAGLLITLTASTAGAQTTHVVTTAGFSFSPANLTINVGDTVEWDWSSDTHTVTEGAGPIPVGGEAFDEILDSGNPTVRVTFDRTFLDAFPRTNNEYDYYCVPHFAFGMDGTIVVRETFGAYIDESQENPPTGSAGTGSGSMTLNLVTNSLAWNISWSGLTGPATAAHFHLGAVGVNGGVQVGIGVSNPNIGSATLTPTQRADLLAGNWYVNIHTAANPLGEIRGQVLSGDWTDLGGGTMGVNGVPRLAGVGPLTGLSTLWLDLQRGPPSEIVLLWLSVTSSPLNALGGTVHAVPPLDQVLLATDPDGRLAGGIQFPPLLPPGTNIWFQFICQDLTTLFDITLSNGVRATTP